MSLLTLNEVFQWAGIVVIAFMLAGVLYMLTDIRRRLGPDLGAPMPASGLEVGALAPNFVAEDKRTGGRVSLSDYSGRCLLVAFMSPRCAPCKELLPSLNRFARERREVPVVVVTSDEAGTEYTREFAEPIAVVGDVDKAIERAFQVGWTPLVYLLDEERKVLNRTVSNSLIDLEDTLDGRGNPQSAAWVPTAAVAGDVVASSDGVAQAGAERPG